MRYHLHLTLDASRRSDGEVGHLFSPLVQDDECRSLGIGKGPGVVERGGDGVKIALPRLAFLRQSEARPARLGVEDISDSHHPIYRSEAGGWFGYN